MKTVMVLIHDDASQEARLQCALDVVRAVDGHLVCMDVVQMPVMTDGFGVGGGAGVLLMDERDREEDNVNRLEPRIANESVSYEWARVHSHSDVAITDNAKLVDLIVVGKQGVGELSESGSTAARLAELTSAPILLVPTEQRKIDLRGKALVIWNGGAAADAAVRAAVPLLQMTGEVEVLTIQDGSIQADPNDVAVYLSRYGCNVTSRTLQSKGDVSAELLEELSRSGAAWCAMGSYGHSRLREQIFGGTSKTLLAKSPIPLLLSH